MIDMMKKSNLHRFLLSTTIYSRNKGKITGKHALPVNICIWLILLT